MNLKTLPVLAMTLALAGCGGLVDTTEQSFRLFPPKAANVQVNNAAWLVGHGPYKDDCWMYAWGCAPPGTPNFSVAGPNPNFARPTYVVETYRVRPSRLKMRSYPRRHRLITKG